MRDPNRIPKILLRLQKLWENHPDYRLGQLIENVFPNTSMTKISAYYVEDEQFMRELEEFYNTEHIFRKGGKKDLQHLLDDLTEMKSVDMRKKCCGQ